MNRRNTPRISFIGFGEAGQAIASGLRMPALSASRPGTSCFRNRPAHLSKPPAKRSGCVRPRSAADAVRETDLVISAVTAASSVDAARSVAPHLNNNPYYLDINSVSPARKQETARLLGERARYVDVAVVAAIHPARHRTPSSSPARMRRRSAPLLHELEMQLSVVGPETGSAAAIKMIRSVMIKGIEALTLECFLAAAACRGFGRSDGVPEEQLSDARLGTDRGLQPRAHGQPRRPAGRRNGGVRRDPARARARPSHGRQSTVARQREMGAIGKLETVRAALKSGRAAILDAINAATKNGIEPYVHMNARSGLGAAASAQISCHHGVSPSTMFRPKSAGRNDMKLRKSCICHVRWSGCCRFCDRLGRAQRGREKEAGGGRAASAAPARSCAPEDLLRCAQPRATELHLLQCLLGRERQRESCQAGCMQRGQDGRRQEKVKEEEGVIRNSV